MANKTNNTVVKSPATKIAPKDEVIKTGFDFGAGTPFGTFINGEAKNLKVSSKATPKASGKAKATAEVRSFTQEVDLSSLKKETKKPGQQKSVYMSGENVDFINWLADREGIAFSEALALIIKHARESVKK